MSNTWLLLLLLPLLLSVPGLRLPLLLLIAAAPQRIHKVLVVHLAVIVGANIVASPW
jgi:hypothetical protein